MYTLFLNGFLCIHYFQEFVFPLTFFYGNSVRPTKVDMQYHRVNQISMYIVYEKFRYRKAIFMEKKLAMRCFGLSISLVLSFSSLFLSLLIAGWFPLAEVHIETFFHGK